MTQPTITERLRSAVSKDGKILPPLELAQRGLMSLAAVYVGVIVFAALAFAIPWVLWAAGAAWLYYRSYGFALPPRVVASVVSSREAYTAGGPARTAKRAAKTPAANAKAQAKTPRSAVGRR